MNSLIACALLLATPATFTPDETCLYECNPIDGMLEEDGTLPTGISVTLILQDGTPGGTDTIPQCDDCKACKQTVEWDVVSSVGGSTYTLLVEEEDFDFRGTRGTGSADGDETLEPHCGNLETISVAINQVNTAPPTWDYRVTYAFSCDC